MAAAAEVDAEARSILERAAASSFPPLHAIHHLLSVGVRLLSHALCCTLFTIQSMFNFPQFRFHLLRKYFWIAYWVLRIVRVLLRLCCGIHFLPFTEWTFRCHAEPNDFSVSHTEKFVNIFAQYLQVCVRCIFRFFGAFSYAAPCLSLTASVLHSFLEEHDDFAKSGSCSCLSKDEAYCSICFGVLLPTCYQDDGVEPLRSVSPIDNVTSIISEAVQREGHQVDEFSLEISLPAVIAANDRAIR